MIKRYLASSNIPDAYQRQAESAYSRTINESLYKRKVFKSSAYTADEQTIGERAKEENIKRLTKKADLKTFNYNIEYNEKIKRFVVQSVDTKTGRIINQFPSEGEIRYLDAVDGILNILA